MVAGLVSLYPVATHLETGFPFFTVIWLVVPLIAVLRWRNAALVGFRTVPRRLFWVTTAINLGLLLLVIALFEPWSHAYGTLVREATKGDTTLESLVRHFTAGAALCTASGSPRPFPEAGASPGLGWSLFLPRGGYD